MQNYNLKFTGTTDPLDNFSDITVDYYEDCFAICAPDIFYMTGKPIEFQATIMMDLGQAKELYTILKGYFENDKNQN